MLRELESLCEHNGWQPVAMKPQKNGTFKGSITVKAWRAAFISVQIQIHL